MLQRTEFISCFVEPTLESSPNCFFLSLIDIENALYIKEIDPIIISAINIEQGQ